jgi:hypothetical protein
MSKFEKIVTMSGAFDKRHADPTKNYGIHGMDIRFVLKNEKGAVQFVVFTGIHLPHVAEEHKGRGYINEPSGADIGYHSPTPMYEGQSSMDCELMPEGKCYYDGSGLQADEFMPEFIAGGTDAVWKMLERRHGEIFSKRLKHGKGEVI